ncbi:hypothetical protein OKA05_21505 [Luteolibacter arcticus]|uniref:Uncharacterized protein n=1 Tax=Luteolibacter arcticus TaxID=1581411 RepID=A0ABT3GNU4_9BACT|nr:hypothetical protein [Luteolibacter arcticus]MCW1925151.1 hypothetical protein [Luteolibacter arcticus]
MPPLFDQAGSVERESPGEAAARADTSARIASVREGRDPSVPPVCQSMTRFVKEHPVLSVGLAFGLGIVAGSCAATMDT